MAQYTLSKETSLFQKDKISTDVTDAGTKATDYLKPVSTTGVYVKPQGQNPSSGSEGNSMRLDNNGLEIYVNSASVAKYGTTARIGATNGVHNVIDSSGFAIKSGNTEVASFKIGNVDSGGSIKSGTRIESQNEIGIYANGNTSASHGLVIDEKGGAPVFYFGRGLQFCPQPYALATSTYSNVSIPLNTNPATSVPMTQIYSSSGHTFMEIDAGCIKFSNDYDAFLVEVTASVYVVPSTNTQATIYLYHYDADMSGAITEVAAGSTYLSSYGGAVQLMPRIINKAMYMSDKLYIGVRLFQSTGTAYCNHKDTFLTVKYV